VEVGAPPIRTSSARRGMSAVAVIGLTDSPQAYRSTITSKIISCADREKSRPRMVSTSPSGSLLVAASPKTPPDVNCAEATGSRISHYPSFRPFGAQLKHALSVLEPRLEEHHSRNKDEPQQQSSRRLPVVKVEPNGGGYP
jgi:hypothetical protein